MVAKKKKRRSYGIGFLLWVTFFIFSAIIVIVCQVSQVAIVRQMQQEETQKNIRNAASEVKDRRLGFDGLYLSDLARKYDITVKIINDRGYEVYPAQSDEGEYYDQIEIFKEKDGSVYPEGSSTYIYVQRVEEPLSNKTYYLYLSDSVVFPPELFARIVWQTIYVTIIILMAVTVLSGLISSYVTKPISDLTERAKKMSSGNLNVDFRLNEPINYRELDELSDTLNFAEGELSKADQMQKELLANVSHDFKTPLTMIKAYAAMIQDISGDHPEKRNKHAQIIIDESDRLATLVNDMLEISKLRAGLDTLKPTLFNLSECLRTVVGRFEYLTDTAGYTFILNVQDDLFVEADKSKIDQVLYNLIGNAVNYTGEDKKVKVRLFAESGIVHFSVTDTGSGISSEEINDIWERYYRSRETHKRPVKGTGLGLSIVKTILTKHEFNFGVQSEVGKGSTFFVDFPAKNVVALNKTEETE